MPCAEGEEFNVVDRMIKENFAIGIGRTDTSPEKDVHYPLLDGFNPSEIPNMLCKLHYRKILQHPGKVDFQVHMDVSHFRPNELSVKVVDGTVIVQGWHGERKDDHGFIEREFVRKYILPESVDAKDVVSTISSDGVLTVKAPLPAIKPKGSDERIVKIQPTGVPDSIYRVRKNKQKRISGTNEGINQTQKRDPAHVIVKQAEESKNQKNEETDNISKGNHSVKQPEESNNQQNEKNNIR